MSTIPRPEGTQPPPPGAPGTVYYLPPPPPPRRGFWGRLLVSLFVFIFIGSLIMNFMLASFAGGMLGDEPRVQEKFVSHNRGAKDKVAILDIEGVITESDEGYIKRAIDTAANDKNVKALVLRVDSPGGSVARSSDYIYHHLRALAENKERKIPIVVSMGSIAASGGYYVSMAVGHTPDTIFAEPTGFTGSIGVIIPHYDFSGLMKKYDVTDDSIVSKPLKGMGSPTKPMSPKEREILQALVDESFKHFKEIVQSGREKFAKDPDALDKLATGQIYTAQQALDNGLVDKLGFIEDAVDQAIKLANLDKDHVKVVRYKAEPNLSSILLGGQSRSSSTNIDLKTVLDSATPRAYYLASWLPAMDGAAK